MLFLYIAHEVDFSGSLMHHDSALGAAQGADGWIRLLQKGENFVHCEGTILGAATPQPLVELQRDRSSAPW